MYVICRLFSASYPQFISQVSSVVNAFRQKFLGYDSEVCYITAESELA